MPDKDIEEIELCIVNMDRIDADTGSLKLPSDSFSSLPPECKIIILQKKDANYLTAYPTKSADTKVHKLYVEVEWGTLGAFVRRFTHLIKDIDGIRFIPELSQGCPGKKGDPCIFHGFLLEEEKIDKKMFLDTLRQISIENEKIVLRIDFYKM